MVMILISCILSEFQMLISVIAGAVWGYIFNAIVLINAVYTKSDYALGNFLMLIRVYSMDINIVQIIILWCICFIFVLWIGTIIWSDMAYLTESIVVDKMYVSPKD